MNKYTYGELEVGMKENFEVTITQSMMDKFFEITDDSNPLHRDKLFANSKGFSDTVVYGMLTASFLSTLAGVYLPGERSLIQTVETKFVKPVMIGDVLTVSGQITEMFDSVQVIVLKVVITNQNNEKVLRGTMKVGVLSERK